MAQPRNARRATNIERFNNLIYNLAKKTLMRVKTTPMVEVTLTARSKLGEKKMEQNTGLWRGGSIVPRLTSDSCRRRWKPSRTAQGCRTRAGACGTHSDAWWPDGEVVDSRAERREPKSRWSVACGGETS
jgi:hypothetical protein